MVNPAHKIAKNIREMEKDDYYFKRSRYLGNASDVSRLVARFCACMDESCMIRIEATVDFAVYLVATNAIKKSHLT